MKNLIIFCISIIAIAAIAANIMLQHELIIIETQEPIIIHDTVLVDTLNVWEKLQLSLMKVESECNPEAVNKTSGASGILQLMPIYVKEANRISGLSYTLDDRFDPSKALEMFEIVQGHHNPEKDIHRAIKLHNSSEWYKQKVLSVFLKL